MTLLLNVEPIKSFKCNKLNGTSFTSLATILSELKIRFKNGISIRKEKIEKIVENRLNTIFRITLEMYGLQYFNKLRKSCMEVQRYYLLLSLWNLSDKDKWQKRYKWQ